MEQHIQKWWDARSDDQRSTLKIAAEKRTLDRDTVLLLFDTRCPIGPIGTAWEGQTEWAWSWPGNVRDFINAQ